MLSITQIDLPYEEDILKNSYSLKSWLRYIDFKNTSKPHIQFSIYERALNQLPFSYKLWYNYLKLLRNNSKNFDIKDPRYSEANNTHERALNYMQKMPRIWIDYLSFLKYQGFITRFRRTFDRSLYSLPTTQHRRVWDVALEFIQDNRNIVEETSLRMYRRFMQLAPEESEDFIEFLINQNRLDEAALKLVDILNDDSFGSKYSKSKFELWQKLCDIITKNPSSITSLDVDAIVRQGISRYSDQVGLLWISLADYYTRSDNVEHARDIYEEAMGSVTTVSDFKLIFNTYDEFNKAIIRRNIDQLKIDRSEELGAEIDRDLARTEDLLNRRPLLLNSVVLKQNPHNVDNWLERVALHESHGIASQLETFNDAINTIDASKVVGGDLSQIYIAMAALYEKNGRTAHARTVFDKAALRRFVKVSDLSDIYCARAEMEVRLQNYEEAISFLRHVVKTPLRHVSYHDDSASVADRVHKSLRLWSFLVDLTRCFCSTADTEHVYDSIIDLHIATPKVILNYAAYLEEIDYFEKSFTVYQKGVSIFHWPTVYDIWLTYLRKFIDRYEGQQSERTNELFRNCLEKCPRDCCKEFYLMYAGFVEKYGLYKKAMDVYEEAIEKVTTADRYNMYILCIEKTKTYYGIVATRAIFTRAVEDELLPGNDVKKIGIRFAEMETQLGEIVRARQLYGHTSQVCDPRLTETEFWSKWHNFETNYGNAETITNMNSIKRSVEARYNTRQSLVNVHLQGEAAMSEDSMQNLEANVQKLTNPIAFVSGGVTQRVEDENPEAMDLDDVYDDEEDEEQQEGGAGDEEDDDMPVEIPIPAAVYGSLGTQN